MNKTKRMLKNAAISVGIGAVPAFVVLWLCNLFMKVNELTYIARITMYKIRITMPLMIGITVMLFAMVSFISRDEKRINKKSVHTLQVLPMLICLDLLMMIGIKDFCQYTVKKLSPEKTTAQHIWFLNSFRFSFCGQLPLWLWVCSA